MVMAFEFVKRAGAKRLHDVTHIGFSMNIANFRPRVLLINAVTTACIKWVLPKPVLP